MSSPLEFFLFIVLYLFSMSIGYLCFKVHERYFNDRRGS